MHKAIDIAHRPIAQAAYDDKGDLITNLKLQKLLYYMQGFHLACFNEPLFEEDIETWLYGPVVPTVYHAYKHCGRQGLKYEGEVPQLTEEEEGLWQAVYSVYGEYGAIGLMHMAHRETPWLAVPKGEGNAISQESMRAFFLPLLEKD